MVMKKTIQQAALALLFLAGFAGVASAQLPSERGVPPSRQRSTEEKKIIPPAASNAVALPSEGKKLPRGAAVSKGVLPSNSATPLLPITERRKRLPSNTKNPIEAVKRKPAGG